MRIAIVHSFYRSHAPSGENAVVELQVKMLRERGHEVFVVSRHSDMELSGPLGAMRGGISVATGVGPTPLDSLRRFRPDVVHVHNLFPGFGTRWAKRVDAPIVATLHNFRPFCANGLLYREGALCKECLSHSPTQALRHRCYRDSMMATSPLVVSQMGGYDRNWLLKAASTVICLSEESAHLFREWGLRDKVVVVPNGVPDRYDTSIEQSTNGRWIVAGRMTPEKGLLDLIHDWPSCNGLDVYGNGPQLKAIEGAAPDGVTIWGEVSQDELTRRMPSYLGLILPSKCIDTQPTVVSEALAAHLPVIARLGTASASLLTEAGAGLAFENKATLQGALESVSARRPEFATRARRLYEGRLSMPRWAAALEAIYEQVSA